MSTPPSSSPVRARPPTRIGLVYGLAQSAGALMLAAGLYLVLGLDWALLVGGAVTFAGAIALEIMGRRPPRQVAPTAPGGDR